MADSPRTKSYPTAATHAQVEKFRIFRCTDRLKTGIPTESASDSLVYYPCNETSGFYFENSSNVPTAEVPA